MSTPEPPQSPAIETYLHTLRAELARAGVPARRVLDEADDHLRDAVNEGLRQGLSPADAARRAVARFGDARMVARRFADSRDRLLHRLLLAASIAIGLSIAFVDSRPRWDDTGVSAAALLLSAMLLGAIGPRRPWAWALAVGVWIPLHSVVSAPSWRSMTMFVVVLIPMVGAYVGMAGRRLLRNAAS
jgi:hypothetical protein